MAPEKTLQSSEATRTNVLHVVSVVSRSVPHLELENMKPERNPRIVQSELTPNKQAIRRYAEDTHISIQTQARCHTHWQVRKHTHETGRKCRDGGSSGDEVALDLCNAGSVGSVVQAAVIRWTFASSPGVRKDGSVDGDLWMSGM